MTAFHDVHDVHAAARRSHCRLPTTRIRGYDTRATERVRVRKVLTAAHFAHSLSLFVRLCISQRRDKSACGLHLAIGALMIRSRGHQRLPDSGGRRWIEDSSSRRVAPSSVWSAIAQRAVLPVTLSSATAQINAASTESPREPQHRPRHKSDAGVVSPLRYSTFEVQIETGTPPPQPHDGSARRILSSQSRRCDVPPSPILTSREPTIVYFACQVH